MMRLSRPYSPLLALLLMVIPGELPASESGEGLSLSGLQSIALYRDEGGALPRFSFPDTLGRSFDNTRLRDKWTLIYFGYTHCPDICPTALTTLASAVRQIESDAKLDRLQVVFITVDPERDNMDTMKNYVRYFHPRFIGARAGLDDLRVLTRALGILHYITRNPDGSVREVAHSGDIVVINPQGRHIGMIQPPMDSQAIASDLARLLASFYKR